MDLKGRRIWYAVAAVVIVLIIIAYAAGWFGWRARTGTPVVNTGRMRKIMEEGE